MPLSLNHRYYGLFVTVLLLLSSCVSNEDRGHRNEEFEVPKFIASEYQNKDFKKSFYGILNSREEVVVHMKVVNGKMEGTIITQSDKRQLAVKGKVNPIGELYGEIKIHEGLTNKIETRIDEYTGTVEAVIIDLNTGREDVIVLGKELPVVVIPEKTYIAEAESRGVLEDGYMPIVWVKHTESGWEYPTVNFEYISSCSKQVRAVLGLMSCLAGADYVAEAEEGPVANYSEIPNLLIQALGFGYQGSPEQLNYLNYWFRKEPSMLKIIKHGYFVSYGATALKQFDSLDLKIEQDIISVRFEITETKNTPQGIVHSLFKGEASFKVFPEFLRVIKYDITE